MIRIVLTCSGFMCLLFCSCKTYAPENLPATQLRFGSGGGFTGMITEYLLLENGQLFVRKGRADAGEWQDLGKVDKSKVKALYRTWETHDEMKETVQEPGNMYYFVTMKKDSLDYRQSWGASNYQPGETLKSFYQQAMELAKTAVADSDLR